MQAVHELGHVLGALTSGGSVQQVMLAPLILSRTDVDPNPNPGWVVWLGPILGSFIPVLVAGFLGRATRLLRKSCLFFAGFYLIANGAYIGGGAVPEIGDCKVMLATGTPKTLMVIFGVTTASFGLLVWHSLGDLANFMQTQNAVNAKVNLSLLGGLTTWILIVSLL